MRVSVDSRFEQSDGGCSGWIIERVLGERATRKNGRIGLRPGGVCMGREGARSRSWTLLGLDWAGLVGFFASSEGRRHHVVMSEGSQLSL